MYTRHFMPRLFGVHSLPVPRTPEMTRPQAAPAVQIDAFVDHIFRGLFSPLTDLAPRNVTAVGVLPRLDISSDEKIYTVSVELPGVQPDAVNLEVRDNMLMISGEKKQAIMEENTACHVSERSFGLFERKLALPEDAVVEGITATHRDGVLSIIIPRQEPEKPLNKTIEITQG